MGQHGSGGRKRGTSREVHPRGNGGLAGNSAANFAQTISFAEFVRQSNDETLVVLHIEPTDAIAELPKILEIQDIDVIFIGPADLSQAVGYPGDLQHPDVQSAMQRIVDLVVPSKSRWASWSGMPPPRVNGGRKELATSTTFDAIVSPAVRRYVEEVRASVRSQN